jgi:hypothetical protein
MKDIRRRKSKGIQVSRNIFILVIAILHQPISKIIENRNLFIAFNLAYLLIGGYFIILLLKDMGDYKSKTQ